jgi:hypothetical protein
MREESLYGAARVAPEISVAPQLDKTRASVQQISSKMRRSRQYLGDSVTRGFTISSTRSGEGCVPRAFHSRTDKTRSVTRMDVAEESARWLTLRSHSTAILARPERFELPTSWFVARHSIQLSYGRADLRPWNSCPRRVIAWRARFP